MRIDRSMAAATVTSLLLLGCATGQPSVRPNISRGAHLPNNLRLAFSRAAEKGDVESTRGLLEKHPLLIDARPDNDSRTPLIMATWRGRADMVRFLIEQGADIEAEDYVWGGSALGWSGWFGRPSVARVLIEAGADINHPNRDGCTPLCSAVAAQQHEPDQGRRQATPEDRSAIVALLEAHGGALQRQRTRPWPIIAGWSDHPD